MTDQEKDPAPVTESESATQAVEPEAPAGGDVSIAETSAPAQPADGSAVPPLGKPPIGKILAGILAVLAIWFLGGIAGSVSKQACIDQAVAKYGYPNDTKSVANLARKNAATKCSDSPF